MNRSQYDTYHENKAHTTPDFPYNTYLCSIPLDFPEVSVHWHNEAELVAVKKGSGRIDVDLISYDVSEGNMILILPGQLHSIHQKAGCEMEYENILFEPSLLGAEERGLCGRLLQPLFAGQLRLPVRIDQTLSYYEDAAACIGRIDSLCSRQSFGYQLAVKGNLFSLMYLLVTHHTERAEPADRKRSIEKVKLILSYISENYTRRLTIEEAAGVCYYSKSHFMKFFKAVMGEGFTSYLNGYRLRIAAQLLLSTSDSVLEISGKTGFENLSYFNRQFKSRYGVSPGQYRKRAETGQNTLPQHLSSDCRS
ncbi:MAG: helix-turn-helix transcriptional regulator [Ruminococcus sp.]|nr:helix-turn-helix transcriptional regulator [Ruminococcus sp.]